VLHTIIKYELPTMSLSRRNFLYQISLATSTLTLPLAAASCGVSKRMAATNDTSSFTFGLIADPHADLIPDKNERLGKFMEKALSKEVDFIIQLGDFCFPKKENLDFLSIWQQYKGPKYHVLGNHDMDVSSKAVIMDFLEMPANYYSFDQQGVHFVVLDANYLFTDHQYLDYDTANFYVNDSLRTYINPEQIDWLKQDLAQTSLPTIIFSHQSLINPIWGIKNRMEVQQLLEKENERVGFQKVIACFNGHDHIDFYRELNGIHYIEVNSMSYQWLGEKYSSKDRYAAALYEQYPNLDKFAPYKDSLFTFIELDVSNGWLTIEGLQSEWLAPSPQDLGVPIQVYGARNSPEISGRMIQIK